MIVNNAGSIDAAEYGINAFNYGNGNITVTNHGPVSGGIAAIDVMPTSTSTAMIDNFGVLMGEVISYNASFVNEFGADWSIVGAADAFTGSSSLLNIGMIESNGTSSITGLSGTTNVGTIQVETGSLQIAGPVTGGGTVMIFGATMEFAAASDAHVQFDTGPAPAGTLLLDDVAQFTGTVTGFGGGDTIDLVGIAPGNVSVSNAGGLHVNYGTGSFALGGNYDPAGFSVTPDGSGGTDITGVAKSPPSTPPTSRLPTMAGRQPFRGCRFPTPIRVFLWSPSRRQPLRPLREAPSRPCRTRACYHRSIRCSQRGLHTTQGLRRRVRTLTLTAVDNFGATDTFHFVFKITPASL